jgi:glycosyltransferase involved in cell wall biosynthesis
VTIPAYQAAGVIGQAVESALDQTSPAHEVIVCDDGSTDDLEAALAPYRKRVLLLRKENGGGASALNMAARAASGEFISLLDADDAYEPERLEAVGELAAARPDLDIVMTDSYMELEDQVVGRFSQETPFAAKAQRTAILDRCFIAWPAVRRDRLLAIGGFDEALRIAYDWDFWIRLLFDRARAGLVDVPLHRYRISAESLSGDRPKALRERVAILDKLTDNDTLTKGERIVLRKSLASKRARANLAEAQAALREGALVARKRALMVMVGRGYGLPTRLNAMLAVLSPRLAARRLECQEARTGRSLLRRSIPDRSISARGRELRQRGDPRGERRRR